MNRPPAFQFYAKDWLSSKKIATMTLEEEGGYIHLLAHCWDSPDCSLPDDDAELAQLSRMGERWVNGGSVKLRACFVTHLRKPGRLFNARLLEERKKQNTWRKKSQKGGKRSAESRVLRSLAHRRVADDSLKGGSRVVEPTGNSSSSSSSSSSELKKKKDEHLASPVYLNGSQAEFRIFWTAYPRKRNKGQAEQAWFKIKPDDVLLGRMLRKIEQATHTSDWIKENGAFIPYPASWLNAKGWEDEYPVSLQRKDGLVL